MSFLYKLTQKNNPHIQIRHKGRKEKRNSLIIGTTERASAFTSRGSITLEASIVIPIFFFAILSLAYLMEMMMLQNTMRNALCSVAREAASQAYGAVGQSSRDIECRIIENIGAEKLDNSIVVGGAGGINCDNTTCNRITGVLELSVRYEVDIPILMFRVKPIPCEEKLRVKAWTGYVPVQDDSYSSKTVYVTDTGLVYHKSPDCTYLDMSIRSVQSEEIENLRNQSGGKYYACESCGKETTGQGSCYITDHGTRYHTSLECKKLHRNIYAISIDEAYGLGGCSKCVK